MFGWQTRSEQIPVNIQRFRNLTRLSDAATDLRPAPPRARELPPPRACKLPPPRACVHACKHWHSERRAGKVTLDAALAGRIVAV